MKRFRPGRPDAGWHVSSGALGDVPIQTIDLPSVGDDPAALGDLYADAEAGRSALSSICGRPSSWATHMAEQ